MKISISKKENGNETHHNVDSLDEVKGILSEFGHDVRFIIKKAQNIIFIDTRPKYEYQVAYYNLSDEEFLRLQNYDDDEILSVDNVSYDSMIDEVLYILENNSYSIKHPWEPIDTEDLFIISAEDFERLLDGKKLSPKDSDKGESIFSRFWQFIFNQE